MAKIILGVASQIAAGKGITTEYLKKSYKAGTYKFSNVLRDLLGRLYLENSRENLSKLSTALRKNFSEDILAKVIYEDVKKDEREIIVVDGVRRLADIVYLKKLPGFRLVFIDADIEKRYQRIILRGENVDDKNKSFEQFRKDHELETELQIADLKKVADVVVDNNGNLEDLYKQVDKIIKEILEKNEK
ncbi:MAG: AAA family ATPase [Candidatus Paceibacterota bacterium]|jgi:dephospho-CoA kinase